MATQSMSDQDDLMTEFLPTFRGSCVNVDCTNNSYARVLSVEELEQTYPATSELPYTPLPPQATHVCDRCGMVYSDFQLGFDNRQRMPPDGSVPIDIEDIDWNPECVYEQDLRSAAMDLIAACPDDADADSLIAVIERWIPGFGKTEAESVIEDSDVDANVHDLADFM